MIARFTQKAFFFFLMFSNFYVFAQDTRATYPNALTLELFGRGIYYSINFDKVLDDKILAGVGFGQASAELGVGGYTQQKSVHLIPSYINYYFSNGQSGLFATTGLTLHLNTSSTRSYSVPGLGLTFGSLPLIPNLGVGYENRSDQGFLFRATLYAMAGNNLALSSGKIWVGMTIGQAF